MPGYFECADSQVLAALDHSLAAFRRRLRRALTRRCAPPSPACGRGASTGPARCCWRLPLTHAGEGLNAEGTRARGKSAGPIGRAHVRTPVTKSHLVCRILLEKKKTS